MLPTIASPFRDIHQSSLLVVGRRNGRKRQETNKKETKDKTNTATGHNDRRRYKRSIPTDEYRLDSNTFLGIRWSTHAETRYSEWFSRLVRKAVCFRLKIVFANRTSNTDGVRFNPTRHSNACQTITHLGVKNMLLLCKPLLLYTHLFYNLKKNW